jgi:F-type H+-transporting ATPase subunit alpha
VAFNDRFFAGVDDQSLPDMLSTLRRQVGESGLTLDSSRQEWSTAVATWLGKKAPGAGE